MTCGDPIIIADAGEVALHFDGIGALFVSTVDGMLVVEAVAISSGNEPRSIVLERHHALLVAAREMWPDSDIEHRDPLGLLGGKAAIAS